MLKLIPTGSLVAILLFSFACSPNGQPLSGNVDVKSSTLDSKPVDVGCIANPYKPTVEPQKPGFIAQIKISPKQQKLLAVMCIGWNEPGFIQDLESEVSPVGVPTIDDGYEGEEGEVKEEIVADDVRVPEGSNPNGSGDVKEIPEDFDPAIYSLNSKEIYELCKLNSGFIK